MEGFTATLCIFGLMGGVILVFRWIVRRPAGVVQSDPPGVRTTVVFHGRSPEFFADDDPDELLVGVQLFADLCSGLSAREVGIENRGTLHNAQRAECVLGSDRLALVFEWIDGPWVVNVEWIPLAAAEKRHIVLTRQVFAPPDSPALRRLLTALDDWLKSHPVLDHIAWHRKERWLDDDVSDPSKMPLALDSA